MVLPASVLALYGFAALMLGMYRFWRETRGTVSDVVDFKAFLRATQDAFSLRYMRGGGVGCNYPDENFSHGRRWFHHLVFYGFLLDFASTTVAAIYDHLLGWHAPYPLFSLPVVLGTVGGIGLLIGTAGLLYLKWRSDKDPSEERMLTMDVAFLVLLFLTSFSGMVLLIFRDTAAMGTLLVVHLAIVAALFLTVPYSKFAHFVYRYAALTRNSIEQSRLHASTSH
jgi:citrate/tricarballylate utilization protein